MKEVITTEHLKHHRLVARQIRELRDRWNDLYSWYPEAQGQHYARYGEVYKESLDEYGEAEFKKYAQMHRLRGVHTAAIDEPRKESHKKVCCYPMHYMEDIRPSVTTNGEYGLIPPSHHHACFARKFIKIPERERFH
ncbi:uncharacterized protein LOC135427675 [Drosophila montana]|uniref:uncharacterized protein LOC135427675 n=1 Tax=Drosophila montana TaxID=40370 RepID=UPI00313AE6EC